MSVICTLLGIGLGMLVSSIVWVKAYDELNSDWAETCFQINNSWSDFAKDLINSKTAYKEGESNET